MIWSKATMMNSSMPSAVIADAGGSPTQAKPHRVQA
jgi:hypothetical protein